MTGLVVVTRSYLDALKAQCVGGRGHRTERYRHSGEDRRKEQAEGIGVSVMLVSASCRTSDNCRVHHA